MRPPWRRGPRRPATIDPSSNPHGAASLPDVIGFGPDIAGRLAVDGFARVGPLIDRSECRRLHDAFDASLGIAGRDAGDAWWPTITMPDADARSFIDDAVGSVLGPRLTTVYDPAVLETVRFDFSVKPGGPQTALGPHQDYSIVDERTWVSYYFWVPLVDTDERNGTLHVLPGSHRYTNRVRSFHVPAVFDPVLDQVEELAVPLECVAGELILMVSGLVHFSPPNRGDEVRLAAHGILKPIAAPLVFFYADDDTPTNEAEMYEVDIDHYIALLLGDLPDRSRLHGTCPREPSAMSPSRFQQGLRSITP